MKKAILISILLIAIISLTSVSASDVNDTFDELSFEDDSSEMISMDESINDNLKATDNYTFEIYNPQELIHETDGFIFFDLPSDAQGNITAFIDGQDMVYDKSAIVNKSNPDGLLFNFAPVWYNNLSKGSHNIVINFLGDNKYAPKAINATFNITQETIREYYFCSMSPAYSGHDGIIFFRLPEDAKGEIKAYIDGKDMVYDKKKLSPGSISRPDNFYNGEVFPFGPVWYNNLSIGSHKLIIRFLGDEKYSASCTSAIFEIYIYPDFDYQFVINTTNEISLNLKENVSGNFSAYMAPFGSDEYELIDCVDILNGNACIYLYCSKLGEYDIKTIYETNHSKHESRRSIEVVNARVDFDYHGVASTYVVSLKIAPNTNGTFSLYQSKNNGKYKLLKTLEISNETKIKVNFTNVGYYQFKAVYKTDYFKGEEIDRVYLNIIEASNAEMFSKQTKTYSVRVWDFDFGMGKNDSVTVKIGKNQYKTKTNDDGLASIKIKNLNPGTYAVKITNKNLTLTKKLTVHSVDLKHVKVKKSAKKLVLKAQLYKKLKNKKITFKFNGKTYKAKTNKNGIAKVTIKSVVLKKLKIGKKIIYKATYLKDTVKRTVKVVK